MMEKIPGIAHFLEHMLFLGSKKYPSANYFSEFIAKNGGYNNAYTEEESTNYFYKIQSSALQESLDIFS